MLTEYKGPANNPDLFQHLVGEKITAAFQTRSQVYLVLESGEAIVFGHASYWREDKEHVDRVVSERGTQIRSHIAELRGLEKEHPYRCGCRSCESF